jgi:hypothetical protein
LDIPVYALFFFDAAFGRKKQEKGGIAHTRFLNK